MSSDVAWAVTRNNSAFLLKKRGCSKPFSTDPLNLTNKHSQRYTGLVNKKAIGVAPGKMMSGCSRNLRSRVPGVNPSAVSYNATSSLVRFENKNIVFCFHKTL
jgi:large subunit ribosomal protein L28e